MYVTPCVRVFSVRSEGQIASMSGPGGGGGTVPSGREAKEDNCDFDDWDE